MKACGAQAAAAADSRWRASGRDKMEPLGVETEEKMEEVERFQTDAA